MSSTAAPRKPIEPLGDEITSEKIKENREELRKRLHEKINVKRKTSSAQSKLKQVMATNTPSIPGFNPETVESAKKILSNLDESEFSKLMSAALEVSGNGGGRKLKRQLIKVASNGK